MSLSPRAYLHHSLPHQFIQRFHAFPLSPPRSIHRKRPAVLAIQPPSAERKRVESALQVSEEIRFALRSTQVVPRFHAYSGGYSLIAFSA